MTFSEFSRLVASAQKSLRQKGLVPGNAILCWEKPSIAFFAAIAAALAAGYQVLLVEPWLPLREIDRIIGRLRPKLLLSGLAGSLLARLTPSGRRIPNYTSARRLLNTTVAGTVHIESLNADSPAVLTFTSGTSGRSKGVVRSHGFLSRQASVIARYSQYETTPNLDLTVFPNLVLGNLGMGKGSLLASQTMSTRFLRALDKLPSELAVDSVSCGPEFLRRLISHTALSELRLLNIGGALSDISLFRKSMRRWPLAHQRHIYGSTEAEPVAFTDLATAIRVSEESGCFQACFLGEPIEEVSICEREDTLWVSGPHVSPAYYEPLEESEPNKWTDPEGRRWHNMGDRVERYGNGLIYAGRDFQSRYAFYQEQALYHALGHSRAFIHEDVTGPRFVVGEIDRVQSREILSRFPDIDYAIQASIYRDRRHRSRIDRKKSLLKARGGFRFCKPRVNPDRIRHYPSFS